MQLELRVLQQVLEPGQPASVPERLEPLEPEQVRQASVQLVQVPEQPVLQQPKQRALQSWISIPV